MNQKFLTLLFTAIFATTTTSTYADNTGPTPLEFLFRMHAVDTPELSRNACRYQSTDVKADLENALVSSGLVGLSYSDLCAGKFCGELTVQDLNLDLTFERDSRIREYERYSLEKLEMECGKFISTIKKMSGLQNSSPETIFKRHLDVQFEKP